MASTTDLDHIRTGPRTAGQGIVTAGDRTGSVKQARRHSTMVKFLRFGLPAGCFLLAAIYGMSLLKTAGLGIDLPALKMPKILPENLTMDNPRYEGFNKDGGSYAFTAKTAQQDLAKPSQIKLSGITGTILEADKTKTDVAAATGMFDQKTSVLELFQDIDVASDSGLKAKLTRATIMTKDSILVSKEPVAVEFPAGTIRSKTMTLRQKAREVTFLDTVVAHLKPAPKAAPAAALAQAAPKAAQNLFTASDAPLDVTSRRLDVKDLDKLAVFTGDVHATQGDQVLSTPELKVSYDGGPGAAPNNAAKGAPEGTAANPGKVRRIVAAGPVVMTRGEADRVTADTADFDAVNEAGILAGNVVMTSGADRMATSDRADLDQKAETILLSGTVVVTQGQTEIKGRRLFVDRKAGKSQLTAPPGSGGPGRITAHFDRSGAEGKPAGKAAASKAAAAAPVAAAATGTPMGAFKTDPKAPLDVEADQLDVNDAAHTAVFRGDVKAAQGDFVIKAAELHASYTGSAGLADVTKPAEPANGQAKTGTEITKIQAKTKVIVTGSDGQTVTGDWADFDAKSNMATVGGNVTLTQNQNTVQGTRLVIDMTTGESTIDTAPTHTTALPAGGGWVTATPDGNAGPTSHGRPSAVFFPMQAKEEMNGKKQTKKDAKGAASSWNATTTAPQPASPGGN